MIVVGEPSDCFEVKICSEVIDSCVEVECLEDLDVVDVVDAADVVEVAVGLLDRDVESVVGEFEELVEPEEVGELEEVGEPEELVGEGEGEGELEEDPEIELKKVFFEADLAKGVLRITG